MKKFLLAAGMVMGLAMSVYAQDPSVVADQVTKELQDSGVITAQDVASVNSSVKMFVKSGATAIEAKNVVAQAAAQAKAQGLKGKKFTAKIHEAIKSRKAQRDEMNKAVQDAVKKAKDTQKKAERDAKKKAAEARKIAENEAKRIKVKSQGAAGDIDNSPKK